MKIKTNEHNWLAELVMMEPGFLSVLIHSIILMCLPVSPPQRHHCFSLPPIS